MSLAFRGGVLRSCLARGACPVTASSQRASFSIWQTVQGKIHDRQAVKEEEQFREQVKRLAGIPKFNLKNFKDSIDTEGQGSWFSWISKVPGVRSMPEVQQAERYMKILKALREEELANPSLIKAREKQRAALESGETVQEINQLLKYYENSVALHKWIRRRVTDGKELPKTRSECQVMMMGEPAGISMTQHMQKQKGSRKQGRLPF